MIRSSRSWQLITLFTVAGCLGLAVKSSSQFSPGSDRRLAVLEGNWQSCREADGQYAERVYDNAVPGIGPFELHMGPYHEFALFRGVQEGHRDHRSGENLLRPFNVEVVANRARQTWEVPGLRLEVALAGGSRDDCESWFVILKRSNLPS